MDLFPLWNSLRIALVATVATFFLGIWLAGVVERAHRVLKGILDVILTLPLVLPPTVVGYLILTVLGPKRPLGLGLMETFGVRLTMVWQGAVVACVVVSFPLMYRTARGAFESFDQTLADAAATLGKSGIWTFWRVKMPACPHLPVPWASMAQPRWLPAIRRARLQRSQRRSTSSGVPAMMQAPSPGSSSTSRYRRSCCLR